MCPCRYTNQNTVACRARRTVRFTLAPSMFTNKLWLIPGGNHMSGHSFSRKIKCSWPTSGSTYGKRTSKIGRGAYVTLQQRLTSYAIRPMHRPPNKTPLTRTNCCTALPVLPETMSCFMYRLSRTLKPGGKT